MGAMAAVDSELHEVVFQVAVIGSVGPQLLDALKANNQQVELPPVAGYKSRFVFHTFADDPWAGDAVDAARLEQLVPGLDALVLTDDLTAGRYYSSSAMERLSKLLAPMKLQIPSAVYGGPALAEEWGSLSGVPVLALVEPTGGDALPILKAIAKALMRSNFRSTPPPPSAG
jgi:hypothetical protein